jgi:ATP-dependent Clp protease ATP-binding subunit ClpA
MRFAPLPRASLKRSVKENHLRRRSFAFLGPTASEKPNCQSVAEFMFGDEQKMVRIAMS